jgi:hypothetical protein
MKRKSLTAKQVADRRAALAAADRSLAIEGLCRTVEGRAVGERWARGRLSADEAVAQLVRHHRQA